MSSTFMIPNKIISGEQALEGAKEVFASSGKKALIVTGKVMEKIGNVARLTTILDALSIEYTVYSEIIGEPTDLQIQQGAVVYKEHHCDFLIGLGGGSPIDSMKAIGMLLTNPGKLSDYMGKTVTNPLPTMIAIPTTAGTGSEATWFTVITDTTQNVKMLLKGPVLLPDVAIIDDSFSKTAPPSVTAACGLDAFTHAVEGYTSRRAQPMTDTFAISAVKRIFTYLPIAYNDGNNDTARKELALAATEAGFVINNSSVTLVHGMSRPIGALFHVPHGMSNAMLITQCLTFALDGAYSRFATLGRAIGRAAQEDSDQEAAEKFIAAVDELCAACQIPTLKAYGIDKEEFLSKMDKMADDAIASGSPANTRKEVTKEDCISIYKKLWN